MPRYFLNLYNDDVTVDEEGVELPNLDSAWDSAIRNIRDIMKGDIDDGRITLAHRIEIVDEFGRILRTVSFSEAVRVEE
jgi:hypothetical protein